MPLSGNLAVDLPSVSDSNDFNDTRAVIDEVDRPVVALSDPVPALVSCKLLAPGRSRVVSESLNSPDNPLTITLA